MAGWQPLVLNQAQQCADCGRDLEGGDRGFYGVGPGLTRQIYLCKDCLEARNSS